MSDRWIWTTSKGHNVDVVHVGTINEVAADDDWYWFAEQPNVREPHIYRLDNLTTGESVEVSTGTICEPWSPYDAISDKLRAWDWTDTTWEEPETCEHGLSASLCSGPNHY